MECSSKENISQEMISWRRENRLIPFAYKKALMSGGFISLSQKTILLTYSFV